MKLADIINPWARIAQLEARNVALEERCEELWQRANDAEAVAFHRASEHYYQRSRMVEEQLRMTQQRFTDIMNLMPPMVIHRPAD